LAAALSIVATGGSDGDGEEFEAPEIPPTILTMYNFEIGSLVNSIPLTVEAAGLGEVSVGFGNTLLGTINLDVSGTGDVTLLSTVTDAGSTMTITVTSAAEPTLSGTAAFNVTEAISAGVFDDPTSGAFEIVHALGTITVDISSTGVLVSLDGGTPVPATWEEFTDLLDDDQAPAFVRVASLAGGAYEFIFELALDAADELDGLEAVTLSSQLVEMCDMFTGTQPPNVIAQGTATISWSGSGELAPGQSFLAEFDNCWFDDPTDDTDELWNGQIQLANYVEEIDANNNLTRIGFAPDASVAGGVEFLSFKIEETDEAMGVFTIDPTNTLVVSGGFSLIFQAAP